VQGFNDEETLNIAEDLNFAFNETNRIVIFVKTSILYARDYQGVFVDVVSFEDLGISGEN
jgi:hypothetical protein